MVVAGANCYYNDVKDELGDVLAPGKDGGPPAQMWPKTGRLYHAARELQSSKCHLAWPFLLTMETWRLQMVSRTQSRNAPLVEKEFHGFVSRVIARRISVGDLRPPPMMGMIPPEGTR
jgi:hypothetical protein